MTNLEIFLFLNLSEVIQENLGLYLPPNSPDLHQNNKMKSCTIPALSFPRNENHKVLKQRWRHFTSLKLCQCSQIPQPPPKVTSTFNRMKTTIIGLIIYKHSTLISIHHLASPPWLKGILDSSSSLTPLIWHQKQKDETSDFLALLFRSATPVTQSKTHPLGRQF